MSGIGYRSDSSITMVRYLKRLTNPQALGRMQAFSMYGGLGISAPSLRRESTDSLIIIVELAIMSVSMTQ